MALSIQKHILELKIKSICMGIEELGDIIIDFSSDFTRRDLDDIDNLIQDTIVEPNTSFYKRNQAANTRNNRNCS